MEVCRKLDNIKLENRPYTEVSIDNNLYFQAAGSPQVLVASSHVLFPISHLTFSALWVAQLPANAKFAVANIIVAAVA